MECMIDHSIPSNVIHRQIPYPAFINSSKYKASAALLRPSKECETGFGFIFKDLGLTQGSRWPALSLGIGACLHALLQWSHISLTQASELAFRIVTTL